METSKATLPTNEQLKIFAIENTWLPGMKHGWGNGYVAIPKGHPCYGLSYNEIDNRYKIEIHGGLTFSANACQGQPKETKGMWIVGFDTAHYMDSMENWPDKASVLKEAETLREQLTNLTFTEDYQITQEKEAAYKEVKELKAANEKLSSDNRVLRQHIKLILDDNYQLPAWKRKQLEAALNTKQ